MKKKNTNTLSIIAFIVSFFSIIIGTILCLVSLSQIKSSHEKGKGFAIAGIIVNLVKIVSVILLFILLLFTPGKSELEYKCKVAKNCTLNPDNITSTCIYEEDGVEEYLTCDKTEKKKIENYGTEDNEDTFDYDREE